MRPGGDRRGVQRTSDLFGTVKSRMSGTENSVAPHKASQNRTSDPGRKVQRPSFLGTASLEELGMERMNKAHQLGRLGVCSLAGMQNGKPGELEGKDAQA